MISRIAMLALVCVGASGLAVAQTPPPDTTTPSSSSRPAPKEAPTTPSSSSRPSSASSPHQRTVTGKENSEQMMKDCIAKERAANSALSKTDAQKTCKEQMESTSKGYR